MLSQNKNGKNVAGNGIISLLVGLKFLTSEIFFQGKKPTFHENLQL